MLLPPINFIFKLLQQRTTVQIWLFEQLGQRIEGKIRGFDEFMNLVIDEAVEVRQSTKNEPSPRDAPDGGRRELGMLFFLFCFVLLCGFCTFGWGRLWMEIGWGYLLTILFDYRPDFA